VLVLSLLLVGVTACRAQVNDESSAASDEVGGEQETSAPPRLPGPPGNEGSEAGPRFTSPLPVPVRGAGGAEDTARVEAWRDDLADDAARVGQLLMLRIYGGGIDEADPRNRALYGVATPREVIETFRPGGILLFRTDAGEDTGNLRNPRQVRRFTDDLREVSGELGPPVTIAVDQEGGLVDRIGHFGTPYPTARELAGDAAAAADHAEVTVTELTALGIDMNFAPVADVDSEPTNPIIGPRAYSEDPETVAEMVVAQLERYRDRGVVPVLKHFPGHGDTTQDSHHTLPTVDADLDLLRDRELVPFARAIDAGAEAIMTAHLRLPEVSGGGPTSMSPAVVTDLLRDELGFDGLIVTDSLEMEGARQDRADRRVALDALQAGHDLLVLPPAPRQSRALLERALTNERLDGEQVDASVDRSLELKATLADADEDRPAPGVVGSDRMERTLTD
jgi:beta-N-acetylhexosaminidase